MAAPTSQLTENAALSLILALVEASPGPLVLLDGDLVIVGASQSFCDAFDIDRSTAQGATLMQLGGGEWRRPALQAALVASLAGAPAVRVCELNLQRRDRIDRHVIIHVQRLAYLDLDNQRIMVAVSDVTQARADQRAIAEAEEHNLVLLREVRHRVANSLQIVASLLLQDARKATSTEAKRHLAEAHNRVMSVAALERQLGVAGEGHVDVRGYITALCENIAASMIGDRDQIDIVVTGSGGLVEARMSLNVGLIVTELVINALKYAFPNGRHGKIVVDCVFPGPNWALVVSDNGVGVPTDGRDARIGLGTTIVNALVKELGGLVEIAPAHPGTPVTISRTAISLVDNIEPLDATPPAISRPAA